MNELILKMLADGEIREQPTTPTSGCGGCIFQSKCAAKYGAPCMAHNRAKRDSIYYVRTRKR